MLTLSLALLAALPVFAADTPSTRLRPDAATFFTLDDAAVAGLRAAMPLSRVHEYGGAVLERAGRYYATEPVTNRRIANIEFTVVVPESYRIAAIYHTHPDGSDESDTFSPNDVRQAKTLNVVSYIGVMADRTIRLYDPNTMRARRFVRSGTMVGGGEVADGRVVAYDIQVALTEAEPRECGVTRC